MKGRDAFEMLISAYEAMAVAYGSRSELWHEMQQVTKERDELRAQVAAAESQRGVAWAQLDDVRASRDAVSAERDDLRAQRDALRAQLAELRAQTVEPSGDSEQLAEPTKDPGELVEPYRWKNGDVLLCGDRFHTVHNVTDDGAVWLSPSVGRLDSQAILEALGCRLHRKASEIKADEPWRAWKDGIVVFHRDKQHGVQIASDWSQTGLQWLWEQGYREQTSVGTDVEGKSPESDDDPGQWREWKAGTVLVHSLSKTMLVVKKSDCDEINRRRWELGYRESASSLRVIVLECDQLDFDAIQKAIAVRQAIPGMPDADAGNLAGKIVAEICRGWVERLRWRKDDDDDGVGTDGEAQS